MRIGELARRVSCIACGYSLAMPLFTPEPLPLATLGWPRSAAEAQAMPGRPLTFVSCVSCGHVWNVDFDYAAVPYARHPNRMFNKGSGWGEFLSHLSARLLAQCPPAGTVVEIGCGEGHFLRGLARARPGARHIGFDPNAAAGSADGLIEVRQELFRPEHDLAELHPSLIIMRHVLEHLDNPLAFLQRIDFCAAAEGLTVALYAEVPCIDRVLETRRLSDFYYEHNSHFTSGSFAALLARAADGVEFIEPGYDGEVIYGLAHLGGPRRRAKHGLAAAAFRRQSARVRAGISADLDRLHGAGLQVVIWGGTGKGAAFMNYYGADAARFPLVVDSDPDKAGTFVPGTGQEIRFREVLRGRTVDVVIVPMAWRARDVAEEMRRCGIAATSMLIEHGGRLVDFQTGQHPYRRPADAPSPAPSPLEMRVPRTRTANGTQQALLGEPRRVVAG